MKEQIIRHYNEQAYNYASQQTQDHRRLHHTDSLCQCKGNYNVLYGDWTTDVKHTDKSQQANQCDAGCEKKTTTDNGTLALSLPDYGILARTDDSQTPGTRGLFG